MATAHDYCLQIHSASGRVLEIFYSDFLEAAQRCTESVEVGYAVQAFVFHYPDFENPVISGRTVK